MVLARASRAKPALGPYQLLNGVIALITGLTNGFPSGEKKPTYGFLFTPFITGDGAHLVEELVSFEYSM